MLLWLVLIISEKFYAYEEAMKECLPKVDPKLVHELLQILKTDEASMYTLEVYLNSDKNIDEIRGEVATFIDEGRHMIAAHRITLELLEEI
jgi:hypothetical protein